MRRSRLLPLLLAPLLLCSGCSGSAVWANPRQLEQIQLIQTVGVDADGDDVRLSVSTGKPMGDEAPLRMTQAAPSLELAMDRLQSYAANASLFYAHTRFLVVGEDAAAAGVAPYLDFVSRDSDMRLSTPMFLLRGGTARDAVLETGDDKTDITENLSAMQQDIAQQGTSHAFTCSEIIQSLATSGNALVCAARRVPQPDRPEAGDTLLPCGYAILKDGALAGFICDPMDMGVNLLLGLGGHGDILLRDANGDAVTVAVDSSKGGFRPVWGADGTLRRIDVTLQVRAAVQELAGTTRLSDEAVRAQLEAALAETVRGWVSALLEQSQTLAADFLGIGGILGERYPAKWQRVRAQWPALLPTMDFQVSVEAEIERTFDLQDPVPVTGGAP